MLDNQQEKFSEKHEDLMRVARETRDNVKEIVIQTQKTNGRVTALETWSKDAQKVIESNSKTANQFRADRIKIWTAISVLSILGSAIISLTIMAINSKIREGFSSPETKQAIKDSVSQVLLDNSNYEKIIIDNTP